jgi:transposase
MGLVERDDGWRIPDTLWWQLEPLIPGGKAHPLGCHNPRVPNRAAMNAILFVLRTGCQWNALNATGICSSSSAHRRLLEWTAAGVFERAWVKALSAYDEFVGVDWSWLSMDGAMTKAPLGGEKTGPNPTDRGKRGTKRSVLTDAAGVPLGLAVDGVSVGAHSAGLSSTQSDGTRSFERTIRREAGEGGGMADRGGRRGAARPCQRQGCRAELLLRRHASWSDAPEREDAGVSRFRSHRVLGLWEWGNGDRPRSATCELVAAVGSDDTPVGDERREGVAHGRGADLGEVTDLAMGHGRGRVGQNPFDTLEG